MKENQPEQLPVVVEWPLKKEGLAKLMGMIAWGRNKSMLEAEQAAKGKKTDS